MRSRLARGVCSRAVFGIFQPQRAGTFVPYLAPALDANADRGNGRARFPDQIEVSLVRAGEAGRGQFCEWISKSVVRTRLSGERSRVPGRVLTLELATCGLGVADRATKPVNQRARITKYQGTAAEQNLLVNPRLPHKCGIPGSRRRGRNAAFMGSFAYLWLRLVLI